MKIKGSWLAYLGMFSLVAICIWISQYSLVWSILTFIIVFTIYRFIIMRKEIFRTMQYIETLLFGKPLDKEFWDGERPPKIRIGKKDDPSRQ